ncbi:MAG: hypothetical protein R2798_06655 [Chitinophagales bacterium]|nr:hypothetical protein [Bacteroidota bacterium]MCB9043688.1 hypothetical protein [Chitinophagales bacterium]
MKNISLLLFSLLLSISSFCFAQKLELVGEQVKIDGNEVLKYEKIQFYNFSLYDREEHEILYFTMNSNDAFENIAENYMILNFVNNDVIVETTDFSHIPFALSAKKVSQGVIQWLVKEKVIDTEGHINEEKLTIFFRKYDQQLTEKANKTEPTIIILDGN